MLLVLAPEPGDSSITKMYLLLQHCSTDYAYVHVHASMYACVCVCVYSVGGCMCVYVSGGDAFDNGV